MLDVNNGIVNVALNAIGLPSIAWNTDLPPLTIIIVMTWQFTPFMMLILLAGPRARTRVCSRRRPSTEPDRSASSAT